MHGRASRTAVWVLAGGAALAVAQGAPGLTALAPVRRRFPGLAGAGRPDHVALTFDDGPDPRFTPRPGTLHDAGRVLARSLGAGRPGLAAEVARPARSPCTVSGCGRSCGVPGDGSGSGATRDQCRRPWPAPGRRGDGAAARFRGRGPRGHGGGCPGRAALAAGRVRPPRAAGRPARRASGGRSPARMTTPCLRDEHRAHEMTTASGADHRGSAEVKAVLCGK